MTTPPTLNQRACDLLDALEAGDDPTAVLLGRGEQLLADAQATGEQIDPMIVARLGQESLRLYVDSVTAPGRP